MNKNRAYHYSRQKLDESDVEMARSVLLSDFLSQGPRLPEFEAKVAEYCGAKYCLAVSNGTAGLHLACKALGLAEGDTGWTSPLSFVASANCIRYCGANVDFIDIDLKTFNVTHKELTNKFEKAHANNKLPKVIIPVHFAGQSCDMKQIKEVADHYECRVIEDACQALGGDYKGEKIGTCEYSDCTVFSLHPVKSITTGEGGLILTNNKELYERIKLMRAHGITRGNDIQDDFFDPWHAEMQCEGYNYKITEFQCALGISQLRKLESFIEHRTFLVERYKENLRDTPVQFQKTIQETLSAWHLLVLLLDFKNLKITKKNFYNEMKAQNINLSVHYYPIHLNPFYQDIGFTKGMFPVSEEYYEKAFTFPLHPGLDLDDVDYICEQIKTFLN